MSPNISLALTLVLPNSETASLLLFSKLPSQYQIFLSYVSSPLTFECQVNWTVVQNKEMFYFILRYSNKKVLFLTNSTGSLGMAGTVRSPLILELNMADLAQSGTQRFITTVKAEGGNVCCFLILSRSILLLLFTFAWPNQD